MFRTPWWNPDQRRWISQPGPSSQRGMAAWVVLACLLGSESVKEIQSRQCANNAVRVGLGRLAETAMAIRPIQPNQRRGGGVGREADPNSDRKSFLLFALSKQNSTNFKFEFKCSNKKSSMTCKNKYFSLPSVLGKYIKCTKYSNSNKFIGQLCLNFNHKIWVLQTLYREVNSSIILTPPGYPMCYTSCHF